MSYLKAKLKNGKEIFIMSDAVALPVSAIENMTAEEIGDAVLDLVPYVERLWAYSYLGSYQRSSFESIEDFERAEALGRIEKPKKQSAKKISKAGFVYLIKGGKHYKIGLTTEPLPIRHKQIGTKLPFKSEIVHAIATSDVVSLERHWHNHFADKRAEGEWFNLSTEDVMIFCCRREMEIPKSMNLPESYA
jgi:Meiotically up-regulated gene 113